MKPGDTMTTDKPAVQTRDVAVAEAEAQSSGFARSVARPERNPLAQLADAIIREGNLEKVKQLMELDRTWRAERAREAFLDAKAAFKKDPPAVIHDLVNKQFDSTYSSLANLVNKVSAALAVHDLDTSWDYRQDGNDIKVVCILRHRLGHEERVPLSAPPDKSGAKNELQQIRSTLTYLKAATFEGVTGIASRAANADDDANSARKQGVAITAEHIETIQNLVAEIDGIEPREKVSVRVGLLDWIFKGDAEGKQVSDIPRDRFDDCCRELNRKRRKKQEVQP